MLRRSHFWQCFFAHKWANRKVHRFSQLVAIFGSRAERCAQNRAYLPPLVGESVLPNGVTFCYPIPADPLVFRDPGTEKAAATQSDNGLMYPAGLEFNDTIHARDCVYKFMSGSYFAPSGSFTHPSLSVSPSRRCVHRRWSPCGATARPPARRNP